MPVQPGARVGSLEIVSKLGEGGMGAVYLARDTRLNRDVAIKALYRRRLTRPRYRRTAGGSHTRPRRAAAVSVQVMRGSAHWLVSVGGGEEPHCAPDGSALYYRVDDRLMMVPIHPGPRFSAGKPSLLFHGLYDLQSETGLSYAVDPNSSRFLMVRLASDSSTTKAADIFHVVLNWASHLRSAP